METISFSFFFPFPPFYRWVTVILSETGGVSIAFWGGGFWEVGWGEKWGAVEGEREEYIHPQKWVHVPELLALRASKGQMLLTVGRIKVRRRHSFSRSREATPQSREAQDDPLQQVPAWVRVGGGLVLAEDVSWLTGSVWSHRCNSGAEGTAGPAALNVNKADIGSRGGRAGTRDTPGELSIQPSPSHRPGGTAEEQPPHGDPLTKPGLDTPPGCLGSLWVPHRHG